METKCFLKMLNNPSLPSLTARAHRFIIYIKTLYKTSQKFPSGLLD